MAPSHGFWDLLTPDERRALSSLGHDRRYPPGATMGIEGDPATHLFVLLRGWVKVLSVSDNGHETVLALRGDGDVIGETAGDTAGPRNATMQAISAAQRLAGLLLDLAGRHGSQVGSVVELALPLSQEDLASLAGTSRATVTRALSSWRERGLIRTGQRR